MEISHALSFVTSQVRFTQQKLDDMQLREVLSVLARWRDVEEDRLRSGSKQRLKKEKEKKLRAMIGREGRVIEMSDIIDSWVRTHARGTCRTR